MASILVGPMSYTTSCHCTTPKQIRNYVLGNRVDTRNGSLNHKNSDMQSPCVRYDIYVIYLKFQFGTKRIAGYMCWFSQNHAQKAVTDVCIRRLQTSVTDVCCWVFRTKNPAVTPFQIAAQKIRKSTFGRL